MGTRKLISGLLEFYVCRRKGILSGSQLGLRDRQIVLIPGQQSTLQWDADRNVSGVDQITNQVTFSYLGAASFGRNTAVFSTNAGLTLESNVTDVRLLYPLGGFLNLSGLRANSLLGPDFAIARMMM